jgi:hypothetical protein
MTNTTTMPDCVPPSELIGNAQVREMCGGVTRHTLLAWRDTQGFPEPVANIPGQGSGTEVWDRRQVTAWLKARERAKRKRS